METLPLWLADPDKAEVVYLDEVDSTNRFLADMVQAGPVAQFTTVWAGHQTAGRGRYQRQWVDLENNSLLLTTYLSVPGEYLSWVTILAGMAMRKALLDNNLQLKWPNDLLLGGKKVGGILSQNLGPDNNAMVGKSQHAIVGIGVNLGVPPTVPGGYAGAVRGIRPEERLDVIHRYLRYLSESFQSLEAGASDSASEIKEAWRKEYLQVLAGKDQEAVIREADGSEKQVVLVGVNLDGALLVSEDGVERTVYTADVALDGHPLPKE